MVGEDVWARSQSKSTLWGTAEDYSTAVVQECLGCQTEKTEKCLGVAESFWRLPLAAKTAVPARSPLERRNAKGGWGGLEWWTPPALGWRDKRSGQSGQGRPWSHLESCSPQSREQLELTQRWGEQLGDSGDHSCYFQTSVRGAQLEMSKRLSTIVSYRLAFKREVSIFTAKRRSSSALRAHASVLSSALKTSPSCSSGDSPVWNTGKASRFNLLCRTGLSVPCVLADPASGVKGNLFWPR